jgi:PadR family transcriptional regulator
LSGYLRIRNIFVVTMREPTFLILSALAGKPLHGYGLIEEVHVLSGGRLKLSIGTLYGALDRLTEEGLVRVNREEVVSGRLRRYYEINDHGATVLAKELSRMRQVADLAESRLRARKAGEAAWNPA